MSGPCRVLPSAALLLALATSACAGPSTMRILNRTASPVVVTVDGAEIAVDPCAERTVDYGAGWGWQANGKPIQDAAAPGAVVVAFPRAMFWPPSDGGPTHVLVAITSDYAGAEMLEDTNYHVLAAGRGRFPADPASLPCAGMAATPLP